MMPKGGKLPSQTGPYQAVVTGPIGGRDKGQAPRTRTTGIKTAPKRNKTTGYKAAPTVRQTAGPSKAKRGRPRVKRGRAGN